MAETAVDITEVSELDLEGVCVGVYVGVCMGVSARARVRTSCARVWVTRERCVTRTHGRSGLLTAARDCSRPLTTTAQQGWTSSRSSSSLSSGRSTPTR